MSKPIEDFLKCDICKNYFDLNSHRPLIIKCGHTFCKHCILSNKGEENNNSCPIDKQEYVLSIESCINNLKLEDIVKNVFNLEEQKTISQKQIIYVKPDIKRNRSPSLKHNNLDNNGNYVNKAKFRSSTSNKYSPGGTECSKIPELSLSFNSKLISFSLFSLFFLDSIFLKSTFAFDK